MQVLAAPIDRSIIGEFAQHLIDCGAIRILGAKSPSDLAGADVATTVANERD
jgi:hypothetical protein